MSFRLWLWMVLPVFFVSQESQAASHGMFEAEAQAQVGALSLNGRWDRANSPSSWNARYDYQLGRLPLEGRVTELLPWSDIHWPSNQAGIAARWNWPQYARSGFAYRTLSEAEVRRMSLDERKKLSPAEKYDVFMERFDYPTVRRIRASSNPRADTWVGICHGWAPAALHHPEPKPVIVTSAHGIEVPFGSGDVKALLDQYYAEPARNRAERFLGTVCKAGSSRCDDVNAGALHVILANELGLGRRAFVADVDRWGEIWNQPVYGFRSVITGYRPPLRGAAAGTVREALVHTEMYYAGELDQARWDPVVGTPDYKPGTEKYDYALELDADGAILGGEWVGSDRPDFLWSMPKQAFTGYMSGINRIYATAGN